MGVGGKFGRSGSVLELGGGEVEKSGGREVKVSVLVNFLLFRERLFRGLKMWFMPPGCCPMGYLVLGL